MPLGREAKNFKRGKGVRSTPRSLTPPASIAAIITGKGGGCGTQNAASGFLAELGISLVLTGSNAPEVIKSGALLCNTGAVERPITLASRISTAAA